MKIFQIAIVVLFAFIVSDMNAQKNDSLQDYLLHKHEISLKSMKVLRTWGIANVGIGIVGSLSSEGSTQYFHQMNAFWGGANILFSSVALKSIKRQESSLSYNELEMEQKKIEHKFLIHAGLDCLFIGVGMGVLSMSNSEGVQKERVEGYGYSIILQGSSLLLFDSLIYFLHKKNRKKRMERLIRTDVYYNN